MTFQEFMKENGGLTLKLELRECQRTLMHTSASMAIFLGKNLLGQKDKPEEEETTEKLIQNMQTFIEQMAKIQPNRNIDDME